MLGIDGCGAIILGKVDGAGSKRFASHEGFLCLPCARTWEARGLRQKRLHTKHDTRYTRAG